MDQNAKGFLKLFPSGMLISYSGTSRTDPWFRFETFYWIRTPGAWVFPAFLRAFLHTDGERRKVFKTFIQTKKSCGVKRTSYSPKNQVNSNPKSYPYPVGKQRPPAKRARALISLSARYAWAENETVQTRKRYKTEFQSLLAQHLLWIYLSLALFVLVRFYVISGL